MEPVEITRRVNLRSLLTEKGGRGNITQLATEIGKSKSQLSQWLNASLDSKSQKPRSISNSSAREIEKALGKPNGWMDTIHARPWTWHNRLDYALSRRGKTWVDLIRITELSKPSVYAWKPDALNRTEMMTGENASRVCDYLGVNPKWLFDGAGESGLDGESGLASEPAQIKDPSQPSPTASTTENNCLVDNGSRPDYAKAIFDEAYERELSPEIFHAVLIMLRSCQKR